MLFFIKTPTTTILYLPYRILWHSNAFAKLSIFQLWKAQYLSKKTTSLTDVVKMVNESSERLPSNVLSPILVSISRFVVLLWLLDRISSYFQQLARKNASCLKISLHVFLPKFLFGSIILHFQKHMNSKILIMWKACLATKYNPNSLN